MHFYFNSNNPPKIKPVKPGPCFLCDTDGAFIVAPDNGKFEGDSCQKPRLLCPSCVEEYYLLESFTNLIQQHSHHILATIPANPPNNERY